MHRSLNKCSRLAASALRGNLVLGNRIVLVYGFSDALADTIAEFQKLRLLKLPEERRIVRTCRMVGMTESGWKELNWQGLELFELQEIATDQSLWMRLIGRIVPKHNNRNMKGISSSDWTRIRISVECVHYATCCFPWFRFQRLISIRNPRYILHLTCYESHNVAILNSHSTFFQEAIILSHGPLSTIFHQMGSVKDCSRSEYGVFILLAQWDSENSACPRTIP